ncbi:MAG: hypothetical protein IJU40_02090 [Desulfovibrionaceae bacterium]|nr:hypothetical protein [Desulfovibrionaceae bacterium]
MVTKKTTRKTRAKPTLTENLELLKVISSLDSEAKNKALNNLKEEENLQESFNLLDIASVEEEDQSKSGENLLEYLESQESLNLEEANPKKEDPLKQALHSDSNLTNQSYSKDPENTPHRSQEEETNNSPEPKIEKKETFNIETSNLKVRPENLNSKDDRQNLSTTKVQSLPQANQLLENNMPITKANNQENLNTETETTSKEQIIYDPSYGSKASSPRANHYATWAKMAVCVVILSLVLSFLYQTYFVKTETPFPKSRLDSPTPRNQDSRPNYVDLNSTHVYGERSLEVEEDSPLREPQATFDSTLKIKEEAQKPDLDPEMRLTLQNMTQELQSASQKIQRLEQELHEVQNHLTLAQNLNRTYEHKFQQLENQLQTKGSNSKATPDLKNRPKVPTNLTNPKAKEEASLAKRDYAPKPSLTEMAPKAQAQNDAKNWQELDQANLNSLLQRGSPKVPQISKPKNSTLPPNLRDWEILGFSGSRVVIHDKEGTHCVALGGQLHGVKILKIDLESGTILTSLGKLTYAQP